MNKIAVLSCLALLGACTSPHAPPRLEPEIAQDMNQAAAHRARTREDAKVSEALMPPLRAEMPSVGARPIEPKFDLSVNNASASQVFMSIVSGTRYSMLVHPNVTGTISVNLKDVTVREALDAIRDLYGYEYRVDGTRVFIQPTTIQTRVFQVNYLIGQRTGRSDLRVTSGSVADAPVSGIPGGLPGAPGSPAPGASGTLTDSSRIQTQTRNDFWEDLGQTLRTIVGTDQGRTVVVNAQAGLVVVRALPTELRNVEAYLKAIRLSVERQVMLEAKIVEVTLSDQYQSGVNWAAFPTSGISVGQASQGTLLQRSSPNGELTSLVTGASGITGNPGARTINNAAFGAFPGRDLINFAVPGGSLFGLAFQTRNFAALLTFLESQGGVQVLSSPRIATINNQKAVLKVGTDEFFITNITGGTTTTTGSATTAGTNTFPTLTLRPFFSGVALDVTPQIDEDSNIILHIHPSVSNVQQQDRQVNLGTLFGGTVTLPVARSTISETDSVVKVGDGNIVAIGGLMKVDVSDSRSGLPGAQDLPGVGGLFGSKNRTAVKKELVILIKPTVVQSDRDLQADVQESRDRILNMMPPSSSQGAAR
jgi:MSHA biogenesis protein MshL